MLVLPMRGGIIDNFSTRSHFNANAHLDGAARDAVLDFVEQKIRTALCGFGRFEVLAAFLWNDAVAPEVADTFAVGEFIRAHGVERLLREARGPRRSHRCSVDAALQARRRIRTCLSLPITLTRPADSKNAIYGQPASRPESVCNYAIERIRKELFLGRLAPEFWTSKTHDLAAAV